MADFVKLSENIDKIFSPKMSRDLSTQLSFCFICYESMTQTYREKNQEFTYFEFNKVRVQAVFFL